jgi:hypothetical protein
MPTYNWWVILFVIAVLSRHLIWQREILHVYPSMIFPLRMDVFHFEVSVYQMIRLMEQFPRLLFAGSANLADSEKGGTR